MMNNEIIQKMELDHPEIQYVLEIADDLIRENRVIQIDLLYKIAKRQLKLENQTIYSIIDLLLKKKILVEGSRMTQSQVLVNRYRASIYDFIKNYPGVHFSVIKKRVFSDKNEKISRCKKSEFT